jgi:hypothetical protein
MSGKLPEPSIPTARRAAIMLVVVALGGFFGGWTYVSLEGGGYPLCLRGATGGMIGGLFGGIVSGSTAWIVSGKAEPLAIVLMAGGGVAGGSHAARDGELMGAAVGILIGGVLAGIFFGVMGRLGLMARRPLKTPPSATPEV